MIAWARKSTDFVWLLPVEWATRGSGGKMCHWCKGGDELTDRAPVVIKTWKAGRSGRVGHWKLESITTGKKVPTASGKHQIQTWNWSVWAGNVDRHRAQPARDQCPWQKPWLDLGDAMHWLWIEGWCGKSTVYLWSLQTKPMVSLKNNI